MTKINIMPERRSARLYAKDKNHLPQIGPGNQVNQGGNQRINEFDHMFETFRERVMQMAPRSRRRNGH